MTTACLPRRYALILGALALAGLEIVGFNLFAIREITWGVPTAFDQTTYGLQSFWLHDAIVRRGFLPALEAYLTEPSPQGLMLQLQGALLCLVLGPGWLRLLNVNFAYFLLLQTATAYVAWSVGGQRARWSVLALGLVLCLTTPYFWAGGLMDFRLDFAAFCLYGIFVAFVIRSDVYEERRWSLAAAAVAALLISVRILTLPYVAGVCGFTAALLLARHHARAWPRIRNIAWTLLGALLLAAPILYLQARRIYAYYWVGHVSGPEAAIRAREVGVGDLMDHLFYYPRQLVAAHLGRVFLVAAAALALAAAARWVRRWRVAARPPAAGPRPDALIFCAVCVLVPLTILTLDVSKSPIAIGLTGSAAVWLVVLGAMALGDKQLLDGWGGGAVAALVFLLGLGHTAWELGQRLEDRFPDRGYPREEVRRLVDVYDLLTEEAARQRGSGRGGLSVFGVHEYLRAETADFLAYDRHRTRLKLTGGLGHTIFDTSRADAIAKIDQSLFVITTPARPAETFLYPADRALQTMIPELTQYVREQFVCMARFSLGGTPFEVYRWPVVTLAGLSDGWVTDAGLDVVIGEAERRRAVALILRGTSEMGHVPGLAAAAIELGDGLAGRARALDTALSVSGNDYTIAVSLGDDARGPGALRLRIGFSKYFVPKDLRMNDDPRRLVILAPQEATLRLDRRPPSAGDECGPPPDATHRSAPPA